MNALKHGERSAERVESRRLANFGLRLLRAEDEVERRSLERIADEQDWIRRIAFELNGPDRPQTE